MTHHPASFYVLHLELARQRDRPHGDSRHGDDLVAPLTPDGHLDPPLWRADPTACRVRRFRPDEDDLVGHLTRNPNGRWCFDYGSDGIDEEPGFRFGNEPLGQGQFISICEADGKFHDFRITAVRPLQRADRAPRIAAMTSITAPQGRAAA